MRWRTSLCDGLTQCAIHVEDYALEAHQTSVAAATGCTQWREVVAFSTHFCGEKAAMWWL